jgi:exodeoxyribonuclease VII large subunit
VLTRGYALVQTKSGTIVSNRSQLKSGDEVMLTLGVGTADATIKTIKNE